MASYTFVNAYAVDTALTPAGKEQNSIDFFDTALGVASINDNTGNFNFSGNDVSAIGINIGGVTYNGWISRPIKVGGQVKGFYFWTDADFTTLALAQADGNTDGDGNVADNQAFVLVVDQSYFDSLGEISPGIKNVGSSSDRVDSALNSLLTTNHAPVAVADTGTAVEAGGLSNATAGSNATGNVLTNDTDADTGDSHTVTAAGTSSASSSVTAGTTSANGTQVTGQYGTLTIGANGTFSYAVNNSNTTVEALRTSSNTLTDTFTYKMSDGTATSTTTLTVTIQGANDTPVANADYNTAKEATTAAVSGITFAGIAATGNVLTNDSDKDSGDGKTVSSSSVTSTGTSSGNSITWSTAVAAVGTNKYVFASSDGVNYTALFDTTGAQLKTDATTAQSADLKTVFFASTPNAAAIALLNGTNDIKTYSNAGGSGLNATITTDGYVFGASTTISMTSVAGITVGATVSGTGVANGTTVTAVDQTAGTITLSAAASLSATSLTFTTGSVSVTGTTFYGDHGTLVLKSDGSYTYTPKTDDSTISSGQSATDTFHYTMQDTAGASSSSTLTITVYGEGSNDPTAAADTDSLTENAASVSKLTAVTGLLSNDGSGTIVAGARSVDSASETAIGTNTSVTGHYGTLSLSSDGTYTYTITAASTVDALTTGQSLTDVFVYRDTNAPTSTGSAVSTLTITITGINDAPTAANDTATAIEKSGLNNATAGYDPSGNVLSNDTDADTAAASLVVASFRTGSGDGTGTAGTLGSALAGTYGSLTLNANGTWSYAVDQTNATVNGLTAVSTPLTDSFNYTVSDGNSGAAHAGVLTVTIQGAADTLAINSVFVNEASPYAIFQVSGVQGTPLTLALSNSTGLSANDTKATLGTDLSNTLEYYNGSAWVTYSGSATIPTGGTMLVRVAITNDSTYEGNESFSLTATSTWSDTASATGIGTIGDEGSGDTYTGTNTTGSSNGAGTDDDRPTVSITSPTVTESAGYAVFTVSLDHASTQSINFTPTVASGTATVGTDTAAASTLEYSTDGGSTWHTVSGHVTIAAGATSIQLRLAITDDSTYEGNETFTLATGYIADAVQNQTGVTGTATITDAADKPTVSVGNTSVAEGGSAVFTVSIDHTSTTDISFTPTVTSGTATVGTDTAAATTLEYSNDGGGTWHTVSGAVTIAAGSSSVQLRIATTDDSTYEGNETFALATGTITGTVTNGTGASGTATITDVADTPTVSVSNTTITEGSSAVFTVSIDHASTTDVSFTPVLTSGTATVGTDTAAATTMEYSSDGGGTWHAVSGAVTIAAGSTSVQLRIATTNDTTYEGDETFTLATGAITGTVTNATGASGTATITDAADKPTVSVDSPTMTEGADAIFTVSVDHLSTTDISFTPTVSSGTATVGTDTAAASTLQYSSDGGGTWHTVSGAVTIAAGQSSVQLKLATTDDAISESNETFTLDTGAITGTVTNGSGASGTATINDNDAAPTFSINDVTVNEAAGTATFTVTRNGATGSAVAVDYATSDDTALAGSDYTAKSGTLNFASGETTKTISVTIANDSVYEGSEAFKVTLSNPSGATITTAVGTGTIKDDGTGSGGTDNDTPTVSVSNTTITEGSSAVFTVSIDHASSTDVSFTPTLTSGTATIGTDTAAATAMEYSTDGGGTWHTVSGAVTIAAGSTSVQLRVATTNDTTYEGDETFTLATGTITGTVTNGTGASGTATITDAADTPTVSVSSPTMTEGADAIFTVSVDHLSTTDISFTPTVSSGTATVGTDTAAATTMEYSTDGGGTWHTVSGAVTIAAGQSSVQLKIATTDDAISESNETFTLDTGAITGTVTNGSGASGTATINDNDSAPTLSIDSVIVNEAAGTATFTVTRSGATGATASVDYATSDDTATDGSDYTGKTGALNFAAGETTKTISVTIANDSVYEGSEAFKVTLSNASGATITTAVGTGTIKDDGTGTGGTDNDTPTVSVSDTTIAEGANAVFTVSIDHASTTDVSFTPTLTSGTATVGTDTAAATAMEYSSDGGGTWHAVSGAVTIAAGDTSVQLRIATTDDAISESDETFTLATGAITGTVTNGTGASGTATITDNDSGSTLSIDDVTVNEAAGTATFTVTRGGATGATASVDYATSDDTATDGSDYTAKTGTLNFAAGETTKTITVTIANDGVYEGSEAFKVTLSNASGATITTAVGTGTIADDGTGAGGTDNDTPTVSVSNATVTEGANAVFTVSIDHTSTTDVSFTPTLTSGTATVGTDTAAATTLEYSSDGGGSWHTVSGAVTIAAGDTSVQLRVATTDDALSESSESFSLDTGAITGTVTNSTGASGTGTITDNDSAGFTIGAISGNTTEGGGTATFTVKLTTQPTSDVVITVGSDDTSEGTVTGGATLTFTSSNWDQVQTVTVKGVDDTIDDGNIGYHATLTAASSDTDYGGMTAQVSITNADNDGPPVLAINDQVVSEADGTVTFTVTRTGASGDPLTVDWATVDGTAHAASDYVADSGTLSFAAGQTSKTITITLVDDHVAEGDEAFTVHLSNIQDSISGAESIGTADGTATIHDDDTPTIVLGVSSIATTEAGGTGTFTVKLSTQPTSDVVITVASDNTSEGTVTGGATLTFTSGNWDQAQTVTVKGVDDTLDDGDIAYHVNLTAASSDGNYDTVTAQVDVTNADDDGPPVVSIGDVTVNEADGTATFTVTRAGGLGDTVSVDYATANGFALAGSDYTAASGTVTFAAGETSKSISVAITDDHVVENSETFTVHLSNVQDSISGAESIGTADGTGTIVDDDTAGFVLGTISGDTSEGGNTATFTVKLSSQPLADVVITVGTDDTSEGTITGGATLTFTSADWDQAQTVTVKGADDTLDDGDIAYHATLSAASADGNYNSMTAQVAITNTDDDGPPVLSIGDVSVNEGDGTATFTVTRTGAAGDALTIDYATVDGTALDAADYTAASGTLSFAAGETSKTITITIADDNLVEGSETFKVHLSNVQDAISGAESIGTADGTGTIADNDTSTLSVAGTQGLSEGSHAVFTVSLSKPIGSDTQVAITLGAGGDTADSADYSSSYTAYYYDGGGNKQALLVSGGEVTLPAGVDKFYVSVDTVDDSVFEGTESFTLAASSTPTGSASATASIVDDGTGTFFDDKGQTTVGGSPDDDHAGISVSGTPDTSEGGTAVFSVALTNPSASATEIALTLGSGADTASGIDYSSTLAVYYFDGFGVPQPLTVTGGKISLPAGVTQFYVGVATAQDHLFEGTETFTLSAAITGGSSDSGTAGIVDDGTGQTYDATGQVTIGTPDDDHPTISVTALPDVSEGSNDVFTVDLSNASTSVTVIAATLHVPSDTTSSTDYSSAFTAYYVSGGIEHAITISGGNIEVPAGVTTFYVKVPTIDDTAFEGRETLTLDLGIAGGSSASATSAILDTGNGHVYDDEGHVTVAPPDDDTPPAPPPPPPGGGGDVPPPFGADLDPTSDNGPSDTDKITSVIAPDFMITAPGILQPGQTVELLTPDGQVAGSSPVGTLEAANGLIDVQVWQLDDGEYTFTARVLDAGGNIVAEAPVHVTIVTDLDGVMPSVELAANGGDFNRDGTPDWQQNNVAQLPIVSLADFLAGKNAPAASFGAIEAGDVHALAPGAAVALDNTAQLLDISIAAQPAPLPANETAASGVFSFAVTAQAGETLHDMDASRPGLQTRVVLELPQGVDATGYVKWDAATASWVSFMDDGNLDTYDNGATLLDTNHDGKIDRVVITLTDGQFGDADGAANGVIVDPGMLVLAAPVAVPVYDVKLANGDHYYSTDAAEAAKMAQGTANVFQGVAFDSLGTDQGGRHLLDNYNPYTRDWYFAVSGAPMPYACYEAEPGAGFQAAAAGQGPGADYHLYLNSQGLTQLVTAAQAQSLGLTAQGYTDRGAIFNTTTASAYQFNVDGYLVANKANADVQALVHNLALQFGSTTDAGFVEAVEQQFLAQVKITGVPHGGTATAVDVNAAFGTAFGS